jgi:hypothetical protein
MAKRNRLPATNSIVTSLPPDEVYRRAESFMLALGCKETRTEDGVSGSKVHWNRSVGTKNFTHAPLNIHFVWHLADINLRDPCGRDIGLVPAIDFLADDRWHFCKYFL